MAAPYVKMFEVRAVSSRLPFDSGLEVSVADTGRGTVIKRYNDPDDTMDYPDADSYFAGVGSDGYLDQFEKMRDNPDVFPAVIRWGFKPRPWVEMEKVDTERAEREFAGMSKVGRDAGFDLTDFLGGYDSVSADEVRSVLSGAGMSEEFERFYDVTLRCRKIMGHHLDLHQGNFGYDSAGDLKIFDY